MMRAVKKGGDRQELHKKIREYSMLAGEKVKKDGKQNDLIDRICADSSFGLSHDEIAELMHPSLYIGCSAEQTERFIKNDVLPYISAEKKSASAEINL